MRPENPVTIVNAAGKGKGETSEVVEVAGTVPFVLSDAAGHITGQNIRVDAGITSSV